MESKTPRIWELKHEGNQHNDRIDAKLLNGNGGWDDILLPDGPVKVIEYSFYQNLRKQLDSAFEITTEHQNQIRALSERNAGLIEALKFYGKDSNWTDGMNYWEEFQLTPCGSDLGQIANAALKKWGGV